MISIYEVRLSEAGDIVFRPEVSNAGGKWNKEAMLTGGSIKGDCWDNAVAESFFYMLKVKVIHQMRFATWEQAKRMIFEHIVMYYNLKRDHLTLGYLSPFEYEKRQALYLN